MEGILTRLLKKASGGRKELRRESPLLVELFQPAEGVEVETYRAGPFVYSVRRAAGRTNYDVLADITVEESVRLRTAVAEISSSLNVASVLPLSFTRLIEALSQSAAGHLASTRDAERVRDLSRLAAFEAVGIPTIYALALDSSVSEFYVDAPETMVYLDHSRYGRCDTPIALAERERKAVETHMDTFKGYTLDYSNPSVKNEFDVFGNRLRISLDLSPLAVNSFSLDVRKLTSTVLNLADLVMMDVLSTESAAFLLAGLELGLNVTIVGETGTGKTTLLNALDEALNPQLRRIYVEDAVETKDLLERGYHQMKLKVDPFERVTDGSRTKSIEITKILHRSPDVVILGEIQSEEHSKAFFHALSAGVRGLQTFHASSTEQAIRRWRETHGISKTNLLDLDVIVQMARPDRLGSRRQVQSIALMVEEEGDARLRDFYTRSGDGRFQRICAWDRLQFRRPPVTKDSFLEQLRRAQAGIENAVLRVNA